jgi:branched-chain amino acid aminotransferase
MFFAPLPASATRASAPDLDRTLGFGEIFTDHMVMASWTADSGWHDGQVTRHEALAFMPGAVVFHYGQAIFEGLKAFRQSNGSIAIFRPAVNAARFIRSADRIAMPPVPVDVFVEALETLVVVDHAWVPSGVGRSLYLRPFMVATEPTLGVRPSATYLFAVIASPVDGFFSATVAPIKVWLSEDYVRAVPGGTGDVKFAGNYAPTLVAQRQAAAAGCDQVVWLDCGSHTQVEEMGAMNVVLVERTATGHALVTPALTGTQLAGVTRDSLLTLAPGLGLDAVERPVSVAEWRAGAESGRYVEAFACGTAAMITPIGEVRSTGGAFTMGDGETGPVTSALRTRLLDIQYGLAPDEFDWMHKV